MAVLLYMQQHVRKPLRLLRHENYATFAEIFTTALLQAAATGETLVGSDQSKSDKVLQKQADKDASKMFRLNQRMQVSCPTPTPLSPLFPPVSSTLHPLSAATTLSLICTAYLHWASSVCMVCLHATWWVSCQALCSQTQIQTDTNRHSAYLCVCFIHIVECHG